MVARPEDRLGFMFSAFDYRRLRCRVTDCPPQILQQEHDMKRVARGRLEGGIDPDVELGRLRSLGMDQERTDADAIGNGCDLEEAVLDGRGAKSPALLADVNAEPCENDDGDLMSADPLFQAFRRVLRRDGPRAQRVDRKRPRL